MGDETGDDGGPRPGSTRAALSALRERNRRLLQALQQAQKRNAKLEANTQELREDLERVTFRAGQLEKAARWSPSQGRAPPPGHSEVEQELSIVQALLFIQNIEVERNMVKESEPVSMAAAAAAAATADAATAAAETAADVTADAPNADADEAAEAEVKRSSPTRQPPRTIVLGGTHRSAAQLMHLRSQISVLKRCCFILRAQVLQLQQALPETVQWVMEQTYAAISQQSLRMHQLETRLLKLRKLLT